MSALDFAALMQAERKKLAQQQGNKRPAVKERSAEGANAQARPAASLEDHEAFAARANLSNQHPLSAHPLAQFRLAAAVPAIAYVPDFLSAEEGEALMRCTYGMPEQAWTQLTRRRLQTYGGTPHPNGMVPAALPAWVEEVVDRLCDGRVFGDGVALRPNHVLLNEYKPGQGIMAHKDGPLYAPRVAILSLGSTTSLEFWTSQQHARSGDAPLASVLCEPNSLVVFEADAYTTYFHGISERLHDDPALATNLHATRFAPQARQAHQTQGSAQEAGQEGEKELPTAIPRGTRLSLTVRHVLHVLHGKEVVLNQAAMDEQARVARDFANSISERS